MVTQATRALAFRALHARPGAFIMPNPWDAGTARLLAHLGFAALATTSAGYAFSVGQLDATIGRDEMLAHVATVAGATDLPLSGDLENGYGDGAATVADTIRRAAAAGLVGGSIEDATGRAADPIYAHDHAVERMRAAAEAARALPFPFTLTARAENFLHGRADLGDTIARLQAYQEAGADVLYAPGLTRLDDIASLVRAVDRPVNVLMGLGALTATLAELAAIGVRRVSIGGSLARAALAAVQRAGREMREHGTFGFAADAITHADISAIMAHRSRST
jgi:2-methylisocitrate lyase-like PEP mutase family enzyme